MNLRQNGTPFGAPQSFVMLTSVGPPSGGGGVRSLCFIDALTLRPPLIPSTAVRSGVYGALGAY